MSLKWEQVTVAASDPAALGRWWADMLGKEAKNRLHLDFRPDDQQAEVDRFLRAGARHADIGQGTQPWVVLADPEGNEFCVLAPPKA